MSTNQNCLWFFQSICHFLCEFHFPCGFESFTGCLTTLLYNFPVDRPFESDVLLFVLIWFARGFSCCRPEVNYTDVPAMLGIYVGVWVQLGFSSEARREDETRQAPSHPVRSTSLCMFSRYCFFLCCVRLPGRYQRWIWPPSCSKLDRSPWEVLNVHWLVFVFVQLEPIRGSAVSAYETSFLTSLSVPSVILHSTRQFSSLL
jgi:hypothetical protein